MATNNIPQNDIPRKDTPENETPQNAYRQSDASQSDAPKKEYKRSKFGIPECMIPFTAGGGYAMLVSIPIALVGCLLNPLIVVVEEKLDKRRAARHEEYRKDARKKRSKQDAEIYKAMEEGKEQKEAIKARGCGEDCPGRKSQDRCLMHGIVEGDGEEKRADQPV